MTIIRTWKRILEAMRGGSEMAAHRISTISGLGNGTVMYELLRMEAAGLVRSRKHTPLYRITDAGTAASEPAAATLELPDLPAPKTKPKPAPAAETTGASEARLTVGEHAVLQYIAANPGKTIAEVAIGMGKRDGAVRDYCTRLSFMGLVKVSDGVGMIRVPFVTEAGARRAAEPIVPTPSITRVPLTSNGPPQVTDLGMRILRALLVSGRPMSRAELSKETGCSIRNIGDPIEKLTRDGMALPGDPRPGKAPLLSLTDKGRRMANGDLVYTAPRTSSPPPSHPKPAPVVEPRDLNNLVPPSLRGRGGIKHPEIPKPAERPKGMSISAWYGATSPNWSVGGSL